MESHRHCDTVDLCAKNCSSHDLLTIIGNRWSLLVMLMISRGRTRNGAMKREISGISQKMLTQTLRTLESNGLVTRTDFGTIPPRVEYALTPIGRTLQTALEPMFGWLVANFDEIQRARAAFAAESAAAA